MKSKLKEAIEAINLHAMWMAGRIDEMTSEDRTKEIVFWGGTNRDERGERLLRYINIINEEVDKLLNPL